MNDLSHIGDDGQARMVDVAMKDTTDRSATARATLSMSAATAELVANGGAKGEVLQTARLAGIMAAKRTAELIPMCHPLGLDHVDVEAEVDITHGTVTLTATARTVARTGVEMEAMTAASVAALTVYDMVKSAERGVSVERIELLEKSGGKSGSWRRDG